MWRIAHCVYRAFRNTATHRCSQDVLIPLTTICTADDDDDSNEEKEKKCLHVPKYDLIGGLKNNQFTFQNIEKLEHYLKHFSIQQVTKKGNAIESTKVKCVVNEVQNIPPANKSKETFDSFIQTDENCKKNVKDLADLHEETMSIINLQLALEALESGDFQLGLETLRTCAKNGTNAAALYNLGICYERGIGVEQDRAKACDYYRQASSLGHTNAQLNLTLLSNQIDIPETDADESLEYTITEKASSSLRELFFRFSFSNAEHNEQSFNDSPFDFPNQSIVCLS